MKGEIGVKLKDLENCREEKHPELIKNKTKPKKHTHSNSEKYFLQKLFVSECFSSFTLKFCRTIKIVWFT